MNRKKRVYAEYDPEFLKAYMGVPAKEKLRFLEEANVFFLRITPRRTKRIWERLKDQGW